MAHEDKASGAAERWLLAADAFLFAAAFVIVASAVLIGINAVTGALDQDTTAATLGALAIQGGSMVFSLVSVAGGAVLAWRLHGRQMTPAVGAFMGLGVIVGTPIAFGLFGGIAFLMSRVPAGTSGGPPWVAIGVLTAAVIALLAMPIVDSIKDARGARGHTRLDMLRWIALAVVIALAVIAFPVMGAIGDSELAEAGIFMVPFSMAAMLAVLSGDLYCRYRDRQTSAAVKAV